MGALIIGQDDRWLTDRRNHNMVLLEDLLNRNSGNEGEAV
jgi:hypothetical protein